jgi:hypothetical protein
MAGMERREMEAVARALLSAAEAFPSHKDLAVQRADAEAAQARGYYHPDEDERLHEVYVTYLGVRAALWEAVGSLQPLLNGEIDEPFDWEEHLRGFGVAFAASAMLVRAGSYMLEMAKDRPVVWKKLDAAEPRFGIPRKSFTQVYENLSSTRRMWRYHEAWRFYELHKSDLASALVGPIYGGVWRILEAEEPFFQRRRRDFLRRRLDFGLFDFQRRHRSGYQKVMFHLFKLSGSAIAELRQPFVKPSGAPKRVSPEICARACALLRPGDILVTRHDDAMSNLFLPGYWPHAALYVGDLGEREALGISGGEALCCRTGGEIRVLEARKDGVLLRALEETLTVDSFVVLRPRLSQADIATALARALEHEGKLYDFLFDFSQSDRLACTALVCRTFHGIGGVEFRLSERAGRRCLSAEDLLDQALGGEFFEVLALYGVGASEFVIGEDARAQLLASYNSSVDGKDG